MNQKQDPPCRACQYSGMEPRGPIYLICFNKEAMPWGKHVSSGSGLILVNEGPRAEGGFCGPEGKLFEQHPGRTPDGSLKSSKSLSVVE